jgi:UDP-glucose:(glucosyl)LPS alpha-1,2-glucosyltransferase
MGIERNEISKNANGGTELMRNLLEKTIDKELLDEFQIFMSRPRDIDYSKIRIFQAHDLPEDPESHKFRDQSFLNDFHKLVFISNWQYQRYQLVHGLPYDKKSIILETGITPAPEDVLSLKDKDKIRITYTSTPQRGLRILIPVFKHLAEKHPDIHLDVFSSFKIYGWDDEDNKPEYQSMYEEIRNHPQMTYHGFVPNEELKSYLNTAHIFAYPCVHLETSCRAMLEAMSAGLVCVHPNYGALPETSGSLNVMYSGDLRDEVYHANIFCANLDAAINIIKNSNSENIVRFNKLFVDSRFGIDRISKQWIHMLNNLKAEYPTVESRAKPKNVTIYRT